MSSSDSLAPARSAKPDLATRRTRLREYQVQLLERMQAAKSEGATRINHLGLLLGSTHWLLELVEASQIGPVGAIMPVPLARDWYLGLSNIRGNLVGVIDIGRYLGMPAASIGPDSRIVTFADALGFNCGLLVTKVLGLRNMADMAAQLDDATGATRYLDSEAQRWNRLDLAALVREPRFLQIGY